MNKKQLFSLALIYFLFIVIFIASTDIILSMPFKDIYRLRNFKTIELDNLSSELKYRVDSFIGNQDVLSTVELKGWAFIPSEQDNDNKEIKLVFVSDHNQYEVETALQERFDQREILLKNNISDYKHGFITKFSSLQIKKGIYKLYIFYYENEEISGVVDTGRMYIKTYRNFSQYGEIPVSEINE